MALLTIACRIFNDYEGAKQLLLWGLPDQSQPVIRDIIECTLLFRLFLRNPNTAKKWLLSSAEYKPGNVNAKLLEMGVKAKEYSLYGVLSHGGHANLLASLSHVEEIDDGEQGMIRQAHFGSARNRETEYFVQQYFLILFFLIHFALKEPLAELYYRHSEPNVFEVWYRKVYNLVPKLEDLISEVTKNSVIGTSEVKKTIEKLVFKKMRFEEFKGGIAGDNNLP